MEKVVLTRQMLFFQASLHWASSTMLGGKGRWQKWQGLRPQAASSKPQPGRVAALPPVAGGSKQCHRWQLYQPSICSPPLHPVPNPTPNASHQNQPQKDCPTQRASCRTITAADIAGKRSLSGARIVPNMTVNRPWESSVCTTSTSCNN